jgi:hypothetical protein
MLGKHSGTTRATTGVPGKHSGTAALKQRPTQAARCHALW